MKNYTVDFDEYDFDEYGSEICSDDEKNEQDKISHPTSGEALWLKIISACSCKKKCFEKLQTHAKVVRHLCVQAASWSSKIRRACTYSHLVASISIESPLFDINKRNQVLLSIPFLGKVCKGIFAAFWGCGRYRLMNLLSDIVTINSDYPHKPEQPGAWYFFSLKKIYQFGIVNEELDRHHHLIYDESVTGKGADEVVSMLTYYLEKCLPRKSDHLIIWADNCGGQNKNSTVIHFLLNLVKTEKFKIVELKFQIKGHTRNSVDRGFGYTKREYNRSEVYSLECMAQVISRSSKCPRGNEKMTPIILNVEHFKKYSEFFSNFYKKCEGIQSYHIFRVENSENGRILCKPSISDREWTILLLEKKKYEQSQLEGKTSKGYSSEKICDFYNKIRQYVPDIFKESLCPQPTDETLFLARKIKNERTGKANLKRKEKMLL